jgi:hypothetical protein
MPTTTTSIGSFLQAVIAIIKADATKTVLPILVGFLSNISNNTSELNIIAQLTALEADLLAAEPNLEQAVIKDIVALLQQDLASLSSASGAASTK